VKPELERDLLAVLVKHRLIPLNFFRDESIRNEYKILCAKSVKPKLARESLAEKNCISIKTLEGILYKKGRKKLIKN